MFSWHHVTFLQLIHLRLLLESCVQYLPHRTASSRRAEPGLVYSLFCPEHLEGRQRGDRLVTDNLRLWSQTIQLQIPVLLCT